MEWTNYVAEKKRENSVSAEIRVVGSYADRLLKSIVFLSIAKYIICLPHNG